MSYQNITGCLSQGAHPGSYNGQDAYNDMLVIDENSKYRQRAIAQHGDGRTGEPFGLYARCPSDSNGGGGDMVEPTYMSDRKGHNGITEDGTATTLNAQEKERPMIAEGGGCMTSVVRRLTPLE